MGELALDINGLSKHLNSDVSISAPGVIGRPESIYNEANPGLGLVYTLDNPGLRKSIIAGFYKNSLNDQSIYAGGELSKRFGKRLFADVGIRGGAVSGYGGIKPMLLPFLGVGFGNTSLNLGYIPRIDGVTPETFTLNTRIRLKK